MTLAEQIYQHSRKIPEQAAREALDFIEFLELATRNSKDFDPAHHAFVEIPYRLNVNQS